MDPVTVATTVELIAVAAKTLQQYSSGEISQEQAHQQLVDAAAALTGAIAMFNAAGPK